MLKNLFALSSTRFWGKKLQQEIFTFQHPMHIETSPYIGGHYNFQIISYLIKQLQ